MAFWRCNNIPQSHIDGLLDKPGVTLDEILAENDVLQEVRSNSRKLIKFICRPETLNELISLIIADPDPNVEYRQQYKLANIACEVLTFDIPEINGALVRSSPLLRRICAVLRREDVLNDLTASFVCKLLILLATKRSESFLDFIQNYDPDADYEVEETLVPQDSVTLNQELNFDSSSETATSNSQNHETEKRLTLASSAAEQISAEQKEHLEEQLCNSEIPSATFDKDSSCTVPGSSAEINSNSNASNCNLTLAGGGPSQPEQANIANAYLVHQQGQKECAARAPSFIDLLINHIDNSAVKDLINRIIEFIDNPELRPRAVNWMSSVDLVPKLVALLSPDNSGEVVTNASKCLCKIIKVGREQQMLLQDKCPANPLLETIESTETIEAILHHALPSVQFNARATLPADSAWILYECNQIFLSLLQYSKTTTSYQDVCIDPSNFLSGSVYATTAADLLPVLSELDQQRADKAIQKCMAAFVPQISLLVQCLVSPIPTLPVVYRVPNDHIELNPPNEYSQTASNDTSILVRCNSYESTSKISSFDASAVKAPKLSTEFDQTLQHLQSNQAHENLQSDEVLTKVHLDAQGQRDANFQGIDHRCRAFGFARLEIVKLIAAMIATGNPSCLAAIRELGAIKVIMDLFFDHPLCSQLHNQVDTIVRSICTPPMFLSQAANSGMAKETKDVSDDNESNVHVAQNVDNDTNANADSAKSIKNTMLSQNSTTVCLADGTATNTDDNSSNCIDEALFPNVLIKIDSSAKYSQEKIVTTESSENAAAAQESGTGNLGVAQPQCAAKHLLADQLFDDCHLIEQILNRYRTVPKQQLGYNGHLRLMANYVIAMANNGYAETYRCVISQFTPELRDRWEAFKEQMQAINKHYARTVVEPLNVLTSCSEGDDPADLRDMGVPTPDTITSAQQAFNDYQMNQLTASFFDQFGFQDDEFTDVDIPGMSKVASPPVEDHSSDEEDDSAQLPSTSTNTGIATGASDDDYFRPSALCTGKSSPVGISPGGTGGMAQARTAKQLCDPWAKMDEGFNPWNLASSSATSNSPYWDEFCSPPSKSDAQANSSAALPNSDTWADFDSFKSNALESSKASQTLSLTSQRCSNNSDAAISTFTTVLADATITSITSTDNDALQSGNSEASRTNDNHNGDRSVKDVSDSSVNETWADFAKAFDDTTSSVLEHGTENDFNNLLWQAQQPPSPNAATINDDNENEF